VTTLAEFLRARREHLQPADVGLPDNGRRRTPGLRREEVATLAGVSIDYLVRLEQGKDTHPSAGVLGALADALRLGDEDRHHLKRLAAISGSPELCPARRPPDREVAPTVTRLLAQLDPTPSFVVGPFNDVLAWNTSWGRLAAPLGMLDGELPNLARYVFLNPTARAVYRDWSTAADDQVNHLRSASVTTPVEGLDELVDDLRASPEFVRRWSEFAVGARHRGTERLTHPDLGELCIDYEVLLVPSDGAQRLISWLAGDEVTALAFAADHEGRVPVSPAQLRVIG
jgi:transcriptional regulator with XRE-family HTH domain